MSVKITQFEAENVKRVRAVELAPAENGLTVIGGRNNQGKTSCLDAIVWALGGDRLKPGVAQRDGSALPPRLRVRLSNGIVVERSGVNGTLKVTDEEGKRAGQRLLDGFVEAFALNMPKFMQATGKEKAATLLRVIGLEQEVDALERQEKDLYQSRLALGRIADQKAKYAAGLPEYQDAPAEPVSASELIARQQDILARNAENRRLRDQRDELQSQKEDLEEQLAKLQNEFRSVCDALERAVAAVDGLEDQSTAQIEEDIRNIEEINQRVRVNQEKERAEDEAREYKAQYEGLTDQIEAVRQKKIELLNGAPLPLPELSVSDGELTYQGKPWDCMSGSDQLKVATAIVRALKPECGFVLVDKLEQMDLDTMREFGQWAEAEGLQIIATRVSTGDECSIIIEDGYSVNAGSPADRGPLGRGGANPASDYGPEGDGGAIAGSATTTWEAGKF